MGERERERERERESCAGNVQGGIKYIRSGIPDEVPRAKKRIDSKAFGDPRLGTNLCDF
jgi:hypothetical protein